MDRPVGENCSKCGARIEDTSHNSHIWELIVKHHFCFSCAFWAEILENKDDPRQVTICQKDGTLDVYHIGPESNERAQWKGFGGAEFTIYRLDQKYGDLRVLAVAPGSQVTKTTNLWHRGVVPAVWLPDFPVNALFMNELKWHQAGNQKYLMTNSQIEDLEQQRALLEELHKSEEVLRNK